MSRYVSGSWSPPVIAPGAEALEVAGGLELDTRAGVTTATCTLCGDWETGLSLDMRLWANGHASTAHDARRPAVLGLDPSLTSAGVALVARHPDGVGGELLTWPMMTVHLGQPGKDGASYADRNTRIVKLVREHVTIIDRCRAAGAHIRLAVIEGPIYGMTGGHAFDRAALFWGIYAALANRGIPVAVVTPSHREAFITGKSGHSTPTKERKALVLDEIRKLWAFPKAQSGSEISLDPDRKIVNNDEADALGLATMGAMGLKWPMPFRLLRRHIENVAKVTWPEVV
jgi:hypothetical protein